MQVQSQGTNRARPDTPHDSTGLNLKPEWHDWRGVGLVIEGLPRSVTTLDLWNHFEGREDLDCIRIFNENKSRPALARVRFSPPPNRPCWSTVEKIKIPGRTLPARCKTRIEPDNGPGPNKVPVPNKPGVFFQSETTLAVGAVQFGFLSKEGEMMVMKELGPSDGPCDITINLARKYMEFTFACWLEDPRQANPLYQQNAEVGRLNRVSFLKAQIPFAFLNEVLFIQDDNDECSLFIHPPCPPMLYRKLGGQDVSKMHNKTSTIWRKEDKWTRATEIMYDVAPLRDQPATLNCPALFIDIGRWTAYRFILNKNDTPVWQRLTHEMTDFNIKVKTVKSTDFLIVSASAPSVSAFWTQLDSHNTKKASDDLALLEGSNDYHLPYEVRYQLEVCISQGIFNEINMSAEFLQELVKLSRNSPKGRNRATDILSYASDQGARIFYPMALFQDKKALMYWPHISPPSYCQMVRKVVITPTSIRLSTPTVELTNRVLRKFASYSDRFIRVQFLDEKCKGRIWPEPGTAKNDQLFTRIFRAMRNGILVAGRHFQFLAYGNSQFRENGAYFFCPDQNLTCDAIRAWMGEFDHIRVVAKYASRLGQCFSTTRAVEGLSISFQRVRIPDIERNGWCFSDGVGKISTYLATEIARQLKMNGKGHNPSAFQFRLGGSKGILVEWPDVKLNEIHLRPSQEKFNAESKGIEIIKPSKNSVATLNRQTITILTNLGVRDDYIIELLAAQTTGYEDAMEDEKKAIALLSRQRDENGVTDTISNMISDGFMRNKEPFLMSVLNNWRAWCMKQLKEKARIVVEKGAFVFGCVDETNTLLGHNDHRLISKSLLDIDDSDRLPQIFLQVAVPTGDESSEVDEATKPQYKVITGTCVLGRNPSLHPGDIRVVQAVDITALKHLRDVVVLPSSGDRDLASMCSGGDLDGDEFFVFWDQNLVPEQRNPDPMHHDAVRPEEIGRDVKIEDICKFFVRYMKNNSLSTIALAHLALADNFGARDQRCIELAKLHSNAVDFVKTGQPAEMDKTLRPRKWPHFMQREPSYHSVSAVGKIFDYVDSISFVPEYDSPFDHRILKRYDLDIGILAKAKDLKELYDAHMMRIMNQREIATEFEVWTTFVLSKPRVGTDYKLQEDMSAVLTGLKDLFYEAALKAAGIKKGEPRMSVKLFRFAAACYRVTWEHVEEAKLRLPRKPRLVGGQATETHTPSPDNMPLISFPWILAEELGNIAIQNEAKPELTELPQRTQLWSTDKILSPPIISHWNRSMWESTEEYGRTPSRGSENHTDERERDVGRLPVQEAEVRNMADDVALSEHFVQFSQTSVHPAQNGESREGHREVSRESWPKSNSLSDYDGDTETNSRDETPAAQSIKNDAKNDIGIESNDDIKTENNDDIIIEDSVDIIIETPLEALDRLARS